MRSLGVPLGAPPPRAAQTITSPAEDSVRLDDSDSDADYSESEDESD